MSDSIIVPDWRRPVVAVPLAQAFPELGTVKEFRSKTCIFNEDRTKLFDVVSDRYSVIDHRSAFEMLEKAMKEMFGEGMSKSVVRSLNGGARIRAEFSIPIPNLEVKRGDLVKVGVQMLNSYDRSSPFIATLYGSRLVCTNGMSVGTSYGSIKAIHSGSNRESLILNRLEDMIGEIPRLRELWREWLDVRMTYEDAVELIGERFPNKYVEPILLKELYPMSKWDLYNHLTRFATHDTATINRRMTFDSTISRMFYPRSEDDELIDIED